MSQQLGVVSQDRFEQQQEEEKEEDAGKGEPALAVGFLPFDQAWRWADGTSMGMVAYIPTFLHKTKCISAGVIIQGPGMGSSGGIARMIYSGWTRRLW